MRLLQIMAGAAHGGAETAFVDMSIALHEAGHTVEAVTRPSDIRVPRLEKAGIKVHSLRFGGKFDLATPRRIRGIIRDFQPDIVQGWMSRASSVMPRWSASMGIPRYLTVSRLGTPYKLKYFKNTDYFVAITPDIKDYLIENGVATDHVCQINNFAETEKDFTPINRADYGVPEDALLLLGMGRLHWDKAFDTLIKAVSQLEGVYLWIAGEGNKRGELEALITALGLEDRVKLLGWRNDRTALFQACDICTFISRDEGFGTVFVQAWAQGTPLLASACDGPRQFVRDGEDGLLVPVDDEQAIVEAVRRLNADPALMKKIAENGLKRYEGEFTKERCVNNYLAWYRDIRAKEGRQPEWANGPEAKKNRQNDKTP
ncbi:MAG: glycosyltransferase [Alphaproteobacteria bacterium]|nr:glycosyltransferase [Alphaproteobacteria bacterium]